MLTIAIFASALLLQATPEDLDRTAQTLTGYSRIERFAEAQVRILECSDWGYEKGTGVIDEVVDTWRRYLQPNGMEFEALMERFNAQVDRIRQESEEELDVALSSREAFTVYQRNFSNRCAALAYDRPNWLKGNPIDFAIATMSWDQAVEEYFQELEAGN